MPLFVEELTKAVLENTGQRDRVTAVLGAASHAAQSVPPTLHASLMARLDRLGPAPKETAQIGAVLGREFSYELIEAVAQRPERELQAALDQLGDAELLFCRGPVPPHASYLFKRALVQDATLLRGRRQELHARVAAASGGVLWPVVSIDLPRPLIGRPERLECDFPSGPAQQLPKPFSETRV